MNHESKIQVSSFNCFGGGEVGSRMAGPQNWVSSVRLSLRSPGIPFGQGIGSPFSLSRGPYLGQLLGRRARPVGAGMNRRDAR